MGTHRELDSTDWLTASVRDREEQNPTEKVGGRSVERYADEESD